MWHTDFDLHPSLLQTIAAMLVSTGAVAGIKIAAVGKLPLDYLHGQPANSAPPGPLPYPNDPSPPAAGSSPPAQGEQCHWSGDCTGPDMVCSDWNMQCQKAAGAACSSNNDCGHGHVCEVWGAAHAIAFFSGACCAATVACMSWQALAMKARAHLLVACTPFCPCFAGDWGRENVQSCWHAPSQVHWRGWLCHQQSGWVGAGLLPISISALASCY
jgi:hypothetical protein